MHPVQNLDPNSQSFKHKLSLVALWLMLFALLFFARAVLMPFLIASLLAYVFQPVLSQLEKITIFQKQLPRWLSVVFLYLFIGFFVFFLGTFFVPESYREFLRLVKEASIFFNSIDEKSINAFAQQIELFLRKYNIPLEISNSIPEKEKISANISHTYRYSIDLISLTKTILNDTILLFKSESKNIITSAQIIFSNIITGLFNFLLILMITAFMLIDTKRLKNFLFYLVPSRDKRSFNSLLNRIDQRLSGVVRGQLTICLVNAILTLFGLLLFDVKFAFILATTAGIFSIVPIFGSIISTIPIVLVSLTISPLTALFMLLWIIGIHTLEANLLNPKIMGDSAKIHPILIILALLVGKHFYGIVGALLAVPIMSILVTIFYSLLLKIKQLDEGVANQRENDRIASKEVEKNVNQPKSK